VIAAVVARRTPALIAIEDDRPERRSVRVDIGLVPQREENVMEDTSMLKVSGSMALDTTYSADDWAVPLAT
jgi:hypothetical protein